MANTKQKIAQNHFLLRLADEGSQVERMNKQASLVRRLVRKLQDGTLGTKTAEPEDDEMSVSVGNETNETVNITHQGGGLLPKLLTGAALLVGGAGAGIGLALFVSRPTAQEPHSHSKPIDTDTRTGLDVSVSD